MTTTRAESFAEVCDAVSRLSSKYGQRARFVEEVSADVHVIVRALGEFMESVRYLNTRRSDDAILKLDSEAAVQDALYLMLRPWVVDLVPENPTGKIANRYTIKDFVSRSARTVIEAKYVRDKRHGRDLSKELHDDIETYRSHEACRHLVFFIYDPNALIPDRAALARQICVERVYDGMAVTCHLVVLP